jgi:D-arabinose 1-dehydrogenase-like Zn-dependent alcohol dehydrogenase
MYGVSEFDRGSFATHTIWKDSFLFHIPDGMDSADAAPLMCAGATVFNAIHAHGVEPAHRVGIVGVGGLGHLCIMVCFAFASFIFCLLISRPVRSEDGLRGRCILQP